LGLGGVGSTTGGVACGCCCGADYRCTWLAGVCCAGGLGATGVWITGGGFLRLCSSAFNCATAMLSSWDNFSPLF